MAQQMTDRPLAALFNPATPTLDKFAAVAAQLRADDADEYLQLLRTMDWHYEFADSSVIRNRGRAKFLRIRELQPTVDRDLSLFKAYRPDCHGVPSIEVAA